MLTQAQREKIEDLLTAVQRAEYDLYTKGAFCWDAAFDAKNKLNEYLDTITVKAGASDGGRVLTDDEAKMLARDPRIDPINGDVVEAEDDGTRYYSLGIKQGILHFLVCDTGHKSMLTLAAWKTIVRDFKVVRFGDAPPTFLEQAP